MHITADQIIATHTANLETWQGLSSKALAGMEKLLELNLAATRALLSESFTHAHSLCAANDVQQAASRQIGWLEPMAEKALSYSRHVYGIAVETSAEFAKTAENKAAEGEKALDQVVGNLVKNAPAGTESALAILQSALVAGKNAINCAQVAAKQTLAAAENTVSTLTEQTLSAIATVSKKA